jgi:hypothetical protein
LTAEGTTRLGGGREFRRKLCRYAQSIQEAIDELAGQVDAPGSGEPIH